MKTFKETLVWREAYNLTLLLYRLTQSFPRCEEFGLKSQMRRASVSVVSNFAEGYKRFSKKEQIYFYKVAEGSLEEVKCQTMLAKDLGYFCGDDYKKIQIIEDQVGRLLCGWIKVQLSSIKP